MPTSSATSLRNRLLGRARLRHLQVFVKVAELQTVKQAADAIGITQPTATQALADLEAMLELRLFLRHSRGMSITRSGQALLPAARRMMAIVDDMATQAAALGQGSQAAIRIGAISAAVGSTLRTVLPRFAAAHPEILLQVQEADFARLALLVADKEVDCAFCRKPAVMPAGWRFNPLWPDRYAIVCGPAHPLAGRKRVSKSDMLAATWLQMPSSIAARQAFDELFAGAAASPRVCSIVTASPVMVESLLAQSELLALVPASVVQAPLAAGRLVQVRSAYAAPFGAIGLLVSEGRHDAALQSFVEAMLAAD